MKNKNFWAKVYWYFCPHHDWKYKHYIHPLLFIIREVVYWGALVSGIISLIDTESLYFFVFFFVFWVFFNFYVRSQIRIAQYKKRKGILWSLI